MHLTLGSKLCNNSLEILVSTNVMVNGYYGIENPIPNAIKKLGPFLVAVSAYCQKLQVI